MRRSEEERLGGGEMVEIVKREGYTGHLVSVIHVGGGETKEDDTARDEAG